MRVATHTRLLGEEGIRKSRYYSIAAVLRLRRSVSALRLDWEALISKLWISSHLGMNNSCHVDHDQDSV